MQIATVRDGAPWICSVYFVLYRKKFYWLSLPERRHSKDIIEDERVAVTIALKATKPVIGVQAEGVAAVVQDHDEVVAVLERYVDKYGQGKDFTRRFIAGDNQHMLYVMTPKKVMLFDEYTSRKVPYKDITNNY